MEDLDILKASWKLAQLSLRERLLQTDTETWQTDAPTHWKHTAATYEESRFAIHNIMDEGTTSLPSLRLVAGVDVSFGSIDSNKANIAVVVLRTPDLQPVYKSCRSVTMSQPYIAGFLAFREVDFIVESMSILRASNPELYPQVVLVDGNGILHPERFGMACHLGVLLDLPCIGVGKNLHCTDGLLRDESHKLQIAAMQDKGDFFLLYKRDAEEILGAALKSTNNSTKPVYVSIGHRCSLTTALRVVNMCSKFRVPEPIRLADISSREYLRNLGETA